MGSCENALQPDWYSQHPTVTPKVDIARYVGAETDIKVPRIFDTLEEAMRFVVSGGNIIIRSESPDQYEGPSGIFESYVISPEYPNHETTLIW